MSGKFSYGNQYHEKEAACCKDYPIYGHGCLGVCALLMSIKVPHVHCSGQQGDEIIDTSNADKLLSELDYFLSSINAHARPRVK